MTEQQREMLLRRFRDQRPTVDRDETGSSVAEAEELDAEVALAS